MVDRGRLRGNGCRGRRSRRRWSWRWGWQPEGELAQAVHSHLEGAGGADKVAHRERARREGAGRQVTENTDGGDRQKRRANDQDDSRNGT
jgi:hypothetical protein